MGKKQTFKIKKNKSYISFYGGVVQAFRTGGMLLLKGSVFLIRNIKKQPRVTKTS